MRLSLSLDRLAADWESTDAIEPYQARLAPGAKGGIQNSGMKRFFHVLFAKVFRLVI